MSLKIKNAKDLIETYPKLDDEAKSFLLGYGEGYIAAKENEAKKKKEEKEQEVKKD